MDDVGLLVRAVPFTMIRGGAVSSLSSRAERHAARKQSAPTGEEGSAVNENEARPPSTNGNPTNGNRSLANRLNGWAATHGRRVRSPAPNGSRADEVVRQAARLVVRPEIARGRRPRPAQRDFLVDVTMLVLAVLAGATIAHASESPIDGGAGLFVFPLLTLALLAVRGMYRPRNGMHFLEVVRSIVAASAIAGMTVGFARLLFGAESGLAESAVVREWALVMTFLIVGRAAISLRSRSRAGSRTLIIGAGQVGHVLARRLLDRPEMGLRPVGFVDDDPLEVGELEDCPVLGSPSQLELIVRANLVEHAILSFSKSSHAEELDVLRRLRHLGVSVSVVPRLFEDIPDRMSVERVGGLPMLSICPSRPRGWQFKVKYGIDRVLAAAAIVVAAPVMLVAAVGTLLTIGRPILFRQRRVGLDGHEFDMLKFRTMRDGDQKSPPMADIEQALTQGLGPGGVEGDDRRSRFGTSLRRMAIDELPQLFNVVRGDMSLVGPRPERDHIASELRESIYRYADRDRVKSGITGWAQVNGLRGRTSLADRVEWDNYYIDNWSLWLDFKIALLTSVAVVRDRFD